MRVDPDLIADLGFDPAAAETFTAKAQETYPEPPLLQVGSIPARALYSVCSGNPVTIIDSPPGGGKTQSVMAIVAHLVNTLGLRVAVGSPTGEQAVSVANRLVEHVHPTQIQFHVADTLPEMLHPSIRPKAKVPAPAASPGKVHGFVMVRTLKSLGLMRDMTDPLDVLIIDEAYQATFTDAAAAAAHATQVILVGDPGQIGPVITVDTTRWTGRFAPHRRAPEAFANHPGTTLSIGATYRLGQATVDVIAPLYQFPFVSARPDRHIEVGTVLGEIEQIALPLAGRADDPAMLAAVADRVEHLLRSGRYVDQDGSRALTPADVTVVAALNAQVVGISALLHGRGLSGVKVGTADKLQGGQWPAVVALDPTCSGSTSGHTLSLGRLCVMLSRHMAHLTWVHDGAWRDLPDDAGLVRTVRTRMLG